MSRIIRSNSNYYSENNTRFVFIDGKCCTHLKDCYAALQEQLSLPDYFGHNLDALDEMLADLDWVEEEEVKIIISHLELLLIYEPLIKQDFLEVLEFCDNEKVSVVYLSFS